MLLTQVGVCKRVTGKHKLGQPPVDIPGTGRCRRLGPGRSRKIVVPAGVRRPERTPGPRRPRTPGPQGPRTRPASQNTDWSEPSHCSHELREERRGEERRGEERRAEQRRGEERREERRGEQRRGEERGGRINYVRQDSITRTVGVKAEDKNN